MFAKHDGSADDIGAVRRVQRRRRHRRPADAGRRLRRRRRLPADRRVRRHRARPQVGGRQPDAGQPGRRRRQPDADERRSATSARRELHRPNILLQEVPRARGRRPRSSTTRRSRQRRRPRAGAIYGSQQPELLRQDGVQYKNTDLSGQPLNGIWAERVLTTNGTINAALRRPVSRTPVSSTPPTSDALAAARPYDGHERDHGVLATTATTFTTIGAAGPGDRSSAPAGVTKIGLFVKHDGGGTARRGQVRLVQGRGRRAAAARRHVAAADDPHARSGLAGRDGRLLQVRREGHARRDRQRRRLGRRLHRVPRGGRRELDRVQRSVHVTTDGTHTIEYRSVDKARQHRGDPVGHVQDRQGRPDHHRQAQRRGAEGQLRR